MTFPGTLDLSNEALRYELDLEKGAALRTFGLPDGAEWTSEDRPGREFAVFACGQRIDGQSAGLVVLGVDEQKDESPLSGSHSVTVKLRHDPTGLEIDSHTIVYRGTPVAEKWITVRNTVDEPVTIDRLDSFHLSLPLDEWQVLAYKSDWGAEFAPIVTPLRDAFIAETRQGRSSKDWHPWLTLLGSRGDLLTICPMWSGNWVLRCEPEEDGSFAVSGGLHDWEFSKVLEPGQQADSIRVVLTLGSGGDLNTVSIPLARVGRTHWYPRNELSRSLPIEWNHWWSYEDKIIDERAFLDNVEVAARLGMDICTLDAGWFGPADGQSEWYDYRGDWQSVNESRFPGGIRVLSDAVHGKGMKFGLWCEIEAVGKLARLANAHPSYVARRDGESLGYLCFGNPQVREWAFGTLDRLIREYRCDWIKLDFNLDPRAGCSCTDHGHGAGDGLFEHYYGYYAVLDQIRAKHPEVLLENCASGGLRIDLGMMRHAHTTFLSDTDWPEHGLQVFWGATTFLAPEVCLHWSYSEWLGQHPHQKFKPNDPALLPHQFDFYTRIAMLGGFGFSQKLPELPVWMLERIGYHIEDYHLVVRRFILEADLYRLTAQPEREGKGDRWAAFQYRMPEGNEHLLFVFRLSGAESERNIRLRDLNSDSLYELTWLSAEKVHTIRGAELLERGLLFAELAEEDSALLYIRELPAASRL
ncbi:alpha-galactosidase [Cohnella endophytica]|uniref:Alpha-galactosidase n=1 Tax=Cohnella endophytica TaxID=2419778 RepID=A0A494XE16_9BACL|nr:alpha-galactosidase [Cohnella endophytica]RKP46706.1 alpha-galactosidase [Cohnella endophytica]